MRIVLNNKLEWNEERLPWPNKTKNPAGWNQQGKKKTEQIKHYGGQ